MLRISRWLFRQPLTARRFRPGVLPLEDRVVPAWYTVELISPPEGDPGTTTATYSGQLLPVGWSQGRTGRSGGPISDPVEAANPAEAIRFGLTGTITVTSPGGQADYPFLPSNYWTGSGNPRPYLSTPAAGGKVRCPVGLEDGFWLGGSDGDWDDWTWTVEVTELPTVSVAWVADAAEAGPTAGAFRFTRSGPMDESLAVSFSVAGTAAEGTDYVSLPRSVTFATGQASVDLEVSPLKDNRVEGPESVSVTILPNPTAYRIGSGSASLAIVDDPAVITVTASGNPSEVGPTTGTFTFSRTGGDVSQALDVSYSVSGTATSGSDYQPLGSLVTIPAGQSSVSVTLTPFADSLIEGPETVRVEVLDIPIIAYRAGDPRAAELAIIDAQIGLRSVTFGGTGLFRIEADPGEPAYPTAPPHWVDVNLDGDTNDTGEYSLPVGYVRNTQMTLSARFEYNGATPGQVLVRADGPGNLDLPATVARIEGSYIVLDPTLVPIAHPDWVEYYETFDIAWSVSLDGGSWTTVGTSKNRMYVTLDTPQLSTIHHTVVWISTKNAPKAKTPEEVTAGTWGKFAGRAVTSEKGKKLHYYKDWDVTTRTGTSPPARLPASLSWATGSAWLGLSSSWTPWRPMASSPPTITL